MYCTRYLFPLLVTLTVLLSGCASGPSEIPSVNSQTGVQGKAQTETPIKVPGIVDNTAKPSPENLVTLYQDALTELNNNNFTTAEKYFLDVTKKHPDFSGPWANLAVIYIEQKHYGKAEESIKKSLEKNPEMAQALNIAGFIEERNGNINKAKNYYEKSIEKKPDYALAHYNLALLYDVYLQNIRTAVRHYQKYLSLLDGEDEKTENWVEELKRNIKSGGT